MLLLCLVRPPSGIYNTASSCASEARKKKCRPTLSLCFFRLTFFFFFCLPCLYVSPFREIPFDLWLTSRVFESSKFRSLFHPGYFRDGPNETAADAMQARRIAVDNLVAKSPRLLHRDMDEVRCRVHRGALGGGSEGEGEGGGGRNGRSGINKESCCSIVATDKVYIYCSGGLNTPYFAGEEGKGGAQFALAGRPRMFRFGVIKRVL